MRHDALRVRNCLIPYERVDHVRIGEIERSVAIVVDVEGTHWRAEGNDAIEIVMQMKPSALEGRRLKWDKNAWMVHNLVGHPLMQLLAVLGFKRHAIAVHDATVPRPR